MSEFLKRRKKGIGGSDAAAILGISPWKNPLAIYLDKTQGDIIAQVENQFTHFGNVLEQVVADEFTRVTGKKVQKYNKLLVHKKYEFLIGNIDRKVVGENAFLECKTTSAFNAKEWEEGIPGHYYAQVQHYLNVGGYDKCYVACLIGGNQFKYHEIERNEAFIEELQNAEIHFWNEYVLKKQEPPIDGHDFTSDYLAIKYEFKPETHIEITSKINQILKELQVIKEQEKQITEHKKLLENQIKDFIGENESASNEDVKISYKFQEKNSLDSKKIKEELPEIYEKYLKTTRLRVLRIKEVTNGN